MPVHTRNLDNTLNNIGVLPIRDKTGILRAPIKPVLSVPPPSTQLLTPLQAQQTTQMTTQSATAHIGPPRNTVVMIPQCHELGISLPALSKQRPQIIVAPASVAEASGLRTGDVIVSINGHAVQGMDSQNLWQLLENSHRMAAMAMV